MKGFLLGVLIAIIAVAILVGITWMVPNSSESWYNNRQIICATTKGSFTWNETDTCYVPVPISIQHEQ